jgi:Right handed beta helix region
VQDGRVDAGRVERVDVAVEDAQAAGGAVEVGGEEVRRAGPRPARRRDPRQPLPVGLDAARGDLPDVPQDGRGWASHTQTTLTGASRFQPLHESRAAGYARTIPARARPGCRRLLLAAAILACTACGSGGGASTPKRAAQCDRTAASAAELESQFGKAGAGETICLSAGDYGTFRAGAKPGAVTVRGAPGARSKLALDFNAVANVRLIGLEIASALIRGESHDIVIERSRFTGRAYVDASKLAAAHVVFDRNTHVDIDTCPTCPQGRVHVDGDSGRPSGVLIEHSLFKGGNADGVRADARGVEIVDNEFTGFRDQSDYHVDPIQLFGGTQVLIKGNWIHDNDVAAGIMIADGTADSRIEDNVVARSGSPYAITLNSDDGSEILHNTFADGVCTFGKRCGIVNLGSKPGAPVGRGTVIRDNVIGGIIAAGADGQGPPPQFSADHNLVRDGAPGNATGVPRYTGPPDRFAGFRLAKGSPGLGAASDGADVGMRMR